MRRVVCDTGPILHFHEISGLDILREVGTIEIPLEVDGELSVGIADWKASRPASIQVVTLNPAAVAEAENWQRSGLLHAGEAAAIALARNKNADWFLTDDAAARLVASTLGIEVHGSLGVVLWAAAVGRIDRTQAHGSLTRLASSSLWLSARVLREAFAALDSICP